ncbi:MAG: carbon-nitrogen family hydrolase [Proteobacteria bacterium]|nr:carbon-nitrogen family hydrolase [Pseudomonadota bacterium]
MTGENKRIRVGIVQPDIRFGDVDENIHQVCGYLDDLGKRGADLALLPELWSCGFDNDHLSVHAEKTPAILEKLSKIASAHQMLIAGSLPEKEGKSIYNTLYLHEKDGRLATSYRKVHLFSFAGEDRFFKSGERAVLSNTSIGRIGLMICYDLRFPELCRKLVVQGAHMILVSAQWPTPRTPHWDALIKARAIENQVFMIASNRRGRDVTNEYSGHSQIVSPSGEVLAMTESDQAILEKEIDLRDIDRVRKAMPCLEERRPDVYGK